jgi:hypothetical protein
MGADRAFARFKSHPKPSRMIQEPKVVSQKCRADCVLRSIIVPFDMRCDGGRPTAANPRRTTSTIRPPISSPMTATTPERSKPISGIETFRTRPAIPPWHRSGSKNSLEIKSLTSQFHVLHFCSTRSVRWPPGRWVYSQCLGTPAAVPPFSVRNARRIWTTQHC